MQSTLWTLRRRIDRLASDDGVYRIVCAHSGLSPAPVSRARFADRQTASVALGLCRAYRRALRQRDPQTPRYDLLVEPTPEHAPIAERLDRSPAAVTEMLQRMADRGLVTYEPYEGATLTPEGRSRAGEYHETYTVLKRFFEEVLDIDDADGEARQFVGVVSPEVADRLDATLLGGDGPARLGEQSSL